MLTKAWVVLIAGSCLAAVTAEEAQKRFAAQDWPGVLSAYEELTKATPGSGLYWFRLGVARHLLQKPDDAMAAYEKARSLKFGGNALFIRGAMLLSARNQNQRAVEWLEPLLASGFPPSGLNGLPALAALQKDPAYATLIARYDNPCGQPSSRAFDFWSGDFDVKNPQGQVVGRNRIEKLMGGCVLMENWSSPGGGEGKSLNWYDAELKKWRQLYIGSNGRATEYVGEMKDGGIIFVHDKNLQDGSRRMMRMSFLPQGEGKVRQFIEESWDGGQSWAPWFDGMYVPR